MGIGHKDAPGACMEPHLPWGGKQKRHMGRNTHENRARHHMGACDACIDLDTNSGIERRIGRQGKQAKQPLGSSGHVETQ
jgi:hypothetical protein